MKEKSPSGMYKWLSVVVFAISLLMLVLFAKTAAELALQMLLWAFVLGISAFALFIAAHPDPDIMTVKWDANDMRQKRLASHLAGSIAVVAACMELFLVLSWHIANVVFAIATIAADVLALFAVIILFAWKIKKAGGNG